MKVYNLHFKKRQLSPSFKKQQLPLLLSFQQLPVCGDLDVQAQLDVHELLVLPELSRHVLLGPLQGQLEVPDSVFGILHGVVATILCIRYLALNGGTLGRVEEGTV